MLQINEELKKHLFTLRPEEFLQLEENILEEGCREPLLIWNNTIVDGHNRYAICTKHNIPFTTQSREFDSVDDAIVWMEDNQLGRRNLTPDQFKLLLGRKYNRLKAQGKRNDLTLSQNGTKLSTAEGLAEEHGVSKNTVKRAGAAVETIDSQGSPELVEQIEQGNISINVAADVATLPVIYGEDKQVIRQFILNLMQKGLN